MRKYFDAPLMRRSLASLVTLTVTAAVAAMTISPVAVGNPDETADTIQEINAAVAAEPTAPPAINTGVAGTPSVGSGDVDLGGDLKLDLPAAGAGRTVDGTTIYDAAGTDAAQVAVQRAGPGTRALINIDDASAPERYEFRLSGDVSRLQLNDDGSVAAYDSTDGLIGGFPAPWARDAAGRSVPTHYEVDGTVLVQLVEHRASNFEYGVTADPIWLGLAIKACMRVRCYSWMPGTLERQILHGSITSGVTQWLKHWFCAKTWIC